MKIIIAYLLLQIIHEIKSKIEKNYGNNFAGLNFKNLCILILLL